MTCITPTHTLTHTHPHRRISTLIGHRAEISNALFNYDSSLIATGSMDQTCKLWDARCKGKAIATLR